MIQTRKTQFAVQVVTTPTLHTNYHTMNAKYVLMGRTESASIPCEVICSINSTTGMTEKTEEAFSPVKT